MLLTPNKKVMRKNTAIRVLESRKTCSFKNVKYTFRTHGVYV